MVKPAAALAAACLLALAIAPHAWAGSDPATPPFPATDDDPAVMLWLRDNTSLGVGRFVAFEPDNVLVVLTDEVSTLAPNLHKVSFRQEATKVDFVARTGGRSVRASGEIDCATGSFKTESLELYSGSDLRGDKIVDDGADPVGRAPRAGSGPAVAVAQVCGSGVSALAPLVNTARKGAPAPAGASPPVPLPPTPRSTARRSPRPAPVEAGPIPAATIPDPAPPPAPAPTRAAQRGSAEVLAQVGAFGSDEAAERAWRRLAEAFPDQFVGRTMRIEPIEVNGAPMFRSTVLGFSSQAEAEALCARLMASSEPCFVRRGP